MAVRKSVRNPLENGCFSGNSTKPDTLKHIDMIDQIDNYYLTESINIEKCQILEYKIKLPEHRCS